jgi:Fe-S oxidoreductase
MPKLKRSLLEYRNDAWKCSRCRMCSIVNPERMKSKKYSSLCPSGTRFKFDPYFAGGKLEIIRALTASPPELNFNERLQHIMYTCTSCGACEAICEPMKGLQPLKAGTVLRETMVKEGYGPLPEHISLIKSIENYDNPWMQPRATRTRWTKKLNFKIKDIKDECEVLYYPGCTASYDPVISDVAVSTVRILNKANVDFGILGKEEKCCGSTVLRVGDRDTFNKIAKKNIEIFNKLKFNIIITSCSGCYSIFKEEYADKINCKVMHSIEYVDKLIKDGKIKLKTQKLKIKNQSVTYHDPCHLGRYWKVYDAPRNVINSIGLELLEMERIKEMSWCCGAGGGVRTAFHDDVALWSAKQRLQEAKNTGVDTLITCCPFCEQNLAEAASSNGMKVIDLLQVVGEVIGNW